MNMNKEYWISMEDKIPREGQVVVYFFGPIGANVGWYDLEGNTFHGNHGLLCEDVTHWYPLPTKFHIPQSQYTEDELSVHPMTAQSPDGVIVEVEEPREFNANSYDNI